MIRKPSPDQCLPRQRPERNKGRTNTPVRPLPPKNATLGPFPPVPSQTYPICAEDPACLWADRGQAPTGVRKPLCYSGQPIGRG